MECYYHPGRESSENCAICGKSICKECGLEIAGKTYCKDCLEKIVGLGIENKASSPSQNQVYEESRVEPAQVERRPITETIYESQNEMAKPEYTQMRDDSPYNIHQNAIRPEYMSETPQQPQVAQNEYDMYNDRIPESKLNSQDYIYPEHSEAADPNLEDKYERYLDDLYYDESELPLDEQLAKDEAQYGSLTRRAYHPRTEEALLREKSAEKPKFETPEEMEARIRAEILAEKDGKKKGIRDSNIHNLNYKEEKEPMNPVDILLTVVLVIVILIVVYYIIYIFVLNAAYPTFMDAIFGLSDPQTIINNLLNPPQGV